MGIGNIADAAREFLDWLDKAGQRVWQVLPLGPTGYGDSPYNSSSSFAGNPLLISLHGLGAQGLLTAIDLPSAASSQPDRIDFQQVSTQQESCLEKAWLSALKSTDSQFRATARGWAADPAQANWLDEWAIYAALKSKFEGSAWFDWPDEVRFRHPSALQRARVELKDEIEFHKFVQFVFFSQWNETRNEAKRKGIEILGDLPFYVAYDSADVWSNQDLFDLDGEGRPRVVAGVPPDYFSPTGQLWGNPIYRWDRLAESGYKWWIDRLSAQLRLFDVIRIDHFRGFASYWEVDAGESTAENGRWREGPGLELFHHVSQRLGHLPLVAEDLGLITDDVRRLRQDLDIPGMRVLQFAFDSIDSEHLPHNLEPASVIYTGTHDNDTSAGWFESADPETRQRALDYLGGSAEDIHWDLIRAALTSVAELAVIPIQDILGLGSASRMNIPGSESGNWAWRLPEGLLDESHGLQLRRLTELSGRCALDTPVASDSASPDPEVETN